MDSLIVPRNLSHTFYFFMRVMARANNLELIVDRRVGDRRASSVAIGADRRAHERRGDPPRTWREADCVVVHHPDE